MAPNSALLEALDLPSVAEDEAISTALTGLITSAVHDDAPKRTLSEIYKVVISYSGKDYLDALHLIPLLVPSTEIAAHDILALIGECGSSREVIITVQEAIEGLRYAFENEDKEEETHSTTPTRNRTSLGAQLASLLDLYASAIPRIKLRRKPASETIQPFVQETEATIKVAAPECNRDQSISLITSISNLSNKMAAWCNDMIADQDADVKTCKAMIKSLLDRTLIALSSSLQPMIAQRTLEKLFPRQTIFSSSRYNWQQGESVVKEVLNSYKLLGYTPTKSGPFSTSDLFFLAYNAREIQPHEVLPPLMPVLISALNTNTFVDESLAVLLKIFHTYQTESENHILPPDFSAGLCNVLPSIASAHPDPIIRNQVFRCLSLVLSASDPHSRFQQLKELNEDPQYPQMRVASVGLVKEALLRAISDPSKEDKYFMKPLFLPSFGPMLFRPNPPDLFSSDISLNDFQEGPEAARLVECLSLYYILIHRDVHNLTGIRDSDVRQAIDANLISPLKSAIDRWTTNTSQTSQGHPHDISAIVSLQIGISRIEMAHAELY